MMYQNDLKVVKKKVWHRQNLNFWDKGQRKQLTQILGIGASYLNDILSRRVSISKYRAKKFEAASRLVLGEAIPWQAWLFNETTKHPAFRQSNRQNERDLIKCS